MQDKRFETGRVHALFGFGDGDSLERGINLLNRFLKRSHFCALWSALPEIALI